MQRLALAIHNHQPVGNFGSVFLDAYDRCYRPFIDLVAEHPKVKLALHYTGPLLEWIEAERPAFLKDLRALVERGQVEMLGGGFYEPMLAVLPDADARGQIARMQDFCETHFGARPTGMWLAERVWDPDLPRVIAPTGIRYTLLDDSHFFAAGLSQDQLSGHYVTEKAGETLSVFPIDKQLRYAIPWKPVPEFERDLQQLQARRGNDPRCLTYGDDGEKFGLWPGTGDWVFGKHWLRDFFRLLSDRNDLVTTVHPCEALAATLPNGSIYLPTASYQEMGEWALPFESQRTYDTLKEQLQREGSYDRYQPFVRGGIWQGFFAKYPESNHLHKRVLGLSARLRDFEDRPQKTPAEALHAQSVLAKARTQLYRSECNCAYWHGLFGGLYLNNLRHALSTALLSGERLLDVAERGDNPFLTVRTKDINADLAPEVSVHSESLLVIASPRLGGSLIEISDLTRAFLLTDVLSRREEGYHQKLRLLDAQQTAKLDSKAEAAPANTHDQVRSKEANLSRFLVFDDYRRSAFLDRFHAPGFQLKDLHAGQDGERGTLSREAYQLPTHGAPRDGDAARIDVLLTGEGMVRTDAGSQAVRVEKRYAFREGRSGFDVFYRLHNRSPVSLSTVFAPELSLTLLAGDAADRLLELEGERRERLNFRGEVLQLQRFALFDGWSKLRVVLSADAPFDLWTYPIETVSQSEGGFERVYQGNCLLLRTQISLAPQAVAELTFHLDLEHPA